MSHLRKCRYCDWSVEGQTWDLADSALMKHAKAKHRGVKAFKWARARVLEVGCDFCGREVIIHEYNHGDGIPVIASCTECHEAFIVHSGMPWPRINNKATLKADPRKFMERARDRGLVLAVRQRGWDAEQWASFCTGAWVNGSGEMLFHEEEGSWGN